jgi:Domain of unknown function (DUF4386)
MKTFVRDSDDLQDSFEPQESQESRPSTVAPSEVIGSLRSPRTLARIAGLLYLVVAVTAFFGVYVQSRIVESGDAAATAKNIAKSTTLYRWGFVSDLVQHTFFLFTALALYMLLRHVNQLVAAAMVIIVAVSVAIQSLNMLNQYTALTVVSENRYTVAFGKAGSDALAMLFSDMQENGVFIAQIFFALWLVPLGYLVFKSGYFPKAFGVLFVIGCFAYLFELFAHFLAPGFADDIDMVTAIIETLSEMPFLLWLLVKGVRTDTLPRPAR